MKRVSILFALVLTLLLAACGQDDSAGDAPAGDDPSEDGDSATDDGEDGDPVSDDSGTGDEMPDELPSGAAGGVREALPPARDIKDGVENAQPRPFERALSDETDDSLHVIYMTGVEPCAVLADIEVEESADTVTITLMEGFLPDENGESPVCIEIAEEVSAQVPISQPLGDRDVIDGATGERVPVDVIKMSDAPAG